MGTTDSKGNIIKKPASPAGSRAFAVNWNDVQVRPFSERDIDSVVDFYYRSPRDLPMIQDLDFNKVPPESQMREILRDEVPANTILAVEYKGRAVGHHQLLNFQNGQAEFWAVLWNADVRGKGIVTVSWFKACRFFLDRFPSLHILLFKAPRTNPYSVRLAKKLPLKSIGAEELALPHARAGIQADVYSVTRAEFDRLHNEDRGLESDGDDDIDDELDEIE